MNKEKLKDISNYYEILYSSRKEVFMKAYIDYHNMPCDLRSKEQIEADNRSEERKRKIDNFLGEID